MSFLFKNTNTHVALDLIIQKKYVNNDNELLELFNKKGYDRSLQGIRQMIYELNRCGLISRNNLSDLRPTEYALKIPEISDKKNLPDATSINQCLELINYLENKELFIKSAIIAFSKNYKNNKDISEYLINLNSDFKSDDQSHVPAMKNFLIYLGILNYEGKFTNLGSKILNYLSKEKYSEIPRVWLEKTYLKNKQTGDYDLGKALWSPQKDRRGADIYKSMTMTNIGDLVLHLVSEDPAAIVGISKIASEVDTTFSGIAGTEWEESDSQRPCYLLRLSEFFAFKKYVYIYTENGLFSKDNQNKLGQISLESKNLFFDKNYRLNQGAYFTLVPLRLVKLINEVYKRENGENLPYFDNLNLDLEEEYVGENKMEKNQFNKLLESKKQIILYGPPGTGKTFKTKEFVVEFLKLYKDKEVIMPITPKIEFDSTESSYFSELVSFIRKLGPDIVEEQQQVRLAFSSKSKKNNKEMRLVWLKKGAKNSVRVWLRKESTKVSYSELIRELKEYEYGGWYSNYLTFTISDKNTLEKAKEVIKYAYENL